MSKQFYKVIITETLQREVYVHAKSSSQAKAVAEKEWLDGVYVLDSGDFVGVDFEVKNEHKDAKVTKS